MGTRSYPCRRQYVGRTYRGQVRNFSQALSLKWLLFLMTLAGTTAALTLE